MDRILLLLDHKENRRLLESWLGRNYQIVPADTTHLPDEPFDLGILDGPALDRLWEQVQSRREAEGPLFLPFLLITVRKDVKMVTRHLWRTVDELILSPIEKVELQARVEMLLRARRFTLESERRYHAMSESSLAGVVIVGKEGRILYANDTFSKICGYTREELLSLSPQAAQAMVHPDDQTRIWGPFQDHLAGKAISPHYEYRGIRKDGTVRWLEMYVGRIDYRDQPALQGIVVDVTERVMAEKARQLLETAIDNAQECIMVSDRENRLTYVNRAFEKLTGYSAAEVLGKTPGILTSGRHDRKFYQDLKSTIYSGRPWQGNITLKKKNGNYYEVAATITPIRNEDGIPEHFVSVHRDITEEREMERRIQQNQRLEAIGTLAGGIAHDFNNLLSPIMGYTELCMADLPTGSEVKENLQEVVRAARRASDLVRQILSFSRRSAHERKPLQMAPIIKEALKLLRASLPVTIDVRQEITDTAEPVIADPTEIHQVVMNLCTNAFHAMPDGGILTVALHAVELDPDACAVIPDCTPGRYLNLSVADTGCGIAPDIRDKIFEPYFTTKKVGQGTGLGLAIIHSIVAACGGVINVYSEPGNGTRFSLYFPVAEDTPTEMVEKATITGSGHERILFIDDDATIVALGKRTLERYGYSVTTSTDPVQALELFKKSPADFDMVITDMTMPGMTGDRLTAALLKIRPDLPIIVCTGFSERMNKGKAQEMEIRRLLSKPVAPGALLATIREIFDSEE